jgi:arylmalonate decarboxylase
MGAKVIGLVVPEAVDTIPAESAVMYPDVTFISRGIGLQSLSSAGYDEAIERVVPAAENLAARGAEAIWSSGRR